VIGNVIVSHKCDEVPTLSADIISVSFLKNILEKVFPYLRHVPLYLGISSEQVYHFSTIDNQESELNDWNKL